MGQNKTRRHTAQISRCFKTSLTRLETIDLASGWDRANLRLVFEQRRQMNKLRVGVVGVGHIGSNHARIYSELDDVAALTAVYDLEVARANSIAKKVGTHAAKSLDEFAGLVDAASIATPTGAHHEIAIQLDRKSTRLNSSHTDISRMPSSA